MDPTKPNNPWNTSKHNPGVKSDRGRIIAILVIIGIIYGIYTAAGPWLNDVYAEVKDLFNFDSTATEQIPEDEDNFDNDYDLDFDFDYNPEPTPLPNPASIPVPKPTPIPNPAPPIPLNSSDFDTEDLLENLREKESEVINELESQGLYDEADQVRRTLEEIEANL